MNMSKIDEALYYAEDRMIRANIPFFVLGKTAPEMAADIDGEITAPITLGVKKGELTKSRIETLKTLLPADTKYTSSKITFSHGEVPIVISIIKKRWAFLQSLQHVFYKTSVYWMPNPLDAYVKIKNLVK